MKYILIVCDQERVNLETVTHPAIGKWFADAGIDAEALLETEIFFHSRRPYSDVPESAVFPILSGNGSKTGLYCCYLTIESADAAAEREACAKIVEDAPFQYREVKGYCGSIVDDSATAKLLSAKIRERGAK